MGKIQNKIQTKIEATLEADVTFYWEWLDSVYICLKLSLVGRIQPQHIYSIAFSTRGSPLACIVPEYRISASMTTYLTFIEHKAQILIRHGARRQHEFRRTDPRKSHDCFTIIQAPWIFRVSPLKSLFSEYKKDFFYSFKTSAEWRTTWLLTSSRAEYDSNTKRHTTTDSSIDVGVWDGMCTTASGMCQVFSVWHESLLVRNQ